MNEPRHSVRRVTAVGWLLLLLGLVLNEWLLAATLSPDGELSGANVLRIRVFDVLCLACGVAVLGYRRRLAATGFRSAARPVLRRLTVAYLATATAVFTLVLLLFFADAAMPLVWRLFPEEDRLQRRLQETRAARREVYAHLSPAEEGELMAETWMRPYRYEPWVGFRERPRSGRFVNVSEEGFRRSGRGERSPGGDAIEVFVFGGSTTFGYGVEDEATIPAHLERHLEQRHPGVEVDVFNFGRSFYYSAQETALLLQLLERGDVPDVAVFVDGVNEGQAQPFYTPEMSRMFEAYANRDDAVLLQEVLERIPVVRFVRSGRRSASSAEDDWYAVSTALEPEAARDAYVHNRQLVLALGELHGFSAYFFLQPMPGYRNELLGHDLQDEGYAGALEHVRLKLELLDQVMDGQHSFSMTHLLQGFEGRAFVDTVHYTSQANDRMAAFIAERVELPGDD